MTDNLYNIVIKLEGASGIVEYINGTSRYAAATEKKATKFSIDINTIDEIVIGTHYPSLRPNRKIQFIHLSDSAFFKDTDYMRIWEENSGRIVIYTPVRANIQKSNISGRQNGSIRSSVSLKVDEIAKYSLNVHESKAPVVTVKLEKG